MLARLNYRNNVRIGPIVMYGNVGYEIFRKVRKSRCENVGLKLYSFTLIKGKEAFDWKNWSKLILRFFNSTKKFTFDFCL